MFVEWKPKVDSSKCCITIEQKKSDVKELQDGVWATIMSSGGSVWRGVWEG